MAKAAGRLHSAEDAAFAMELAGVLVSSRHLQRIAFEIGSELQRQRDRKAAVGRRRLPVRVAHTPEVVAVEIDGGHLRTRAAEGGPGVHEASNQEDKIACLVSLDSKVYEHDPQPEPPPSFLEPRRVHRLVQQMQGLSPERPGDGQETDGASTTASATAGASERTGAPHRKVRTCVASMATSAQFGLLVAAEAQERDFYRARRRAFLADGAKYNWSIQKRFFADFVAIADLLHVLCYLYLAAYAVGKDEAQKWSIYVGWLWACWQGRVNEVIQELHLWQARIGKPPPKEELDDKDPRKLVAGALTYLENNQERMDYPRYRKEGLPITSSLAESLVGEFNARVKSKQKYWNRPQGAEAILQLRAALLSEDQRLERHFEHRPGCPYRRRPAA
jgi:hypothetical protein